ncbi:DcaP family trimeric outer membrane transporter [Alteromonas lipolytica]
MATTVQANTAGDTSFNFTGYVKVDALVSDYSDGTLGPQSLGRDLYVPSLTPIGGQSEGAQFDFHAKTSRFRLSSVTDDGNGDQIKGVIELDFIVTEGGNERISNSYTTRIRHAYIQYKNWMVGQNWSNFMDVSALPETLDFIGSTDGITFARQPQVRYTNGAFSFSLENPETTINPEGGGARIVTDDNSVPDFVATYTAKQDWGYVKFAGILRQLRYDNGTMDDATNGYGATVTGKYNLSNGDDIRFSFYTGSGLGRYGSLNLVNGAVLKNDGSLEAIDSMGYFVGYRHMWNEKLRSSLTFSAAHVDNDTAISGLATTKQVYSTRVNLLYSPVKSITIGAEYAYANRENEAGAEGDMNRVQFSAKYAF